MKKMTLVMLFFIGAIGILGACSTNNNEKNAESESVKKQSSREDENMIYKETKGKNVTYYTMHPDPVFGATATIIEKDGKGLLVDTQFSNKDADNIVNFAKDQGINIETIYISYSDPDYYFGTNQVQKAFPNAKVVATERTIDRIKNTYVSKLDVWSETLKNNAPEKIVIPEEITNSVELAGVKFSIFGSDAAKQTLYNEEDNLLLGGILVSTDGHLFMADTKTVASQEEWIKDLEELAALNPVVVIPGHFGTGNDFSSANIQFTKKYVEKFIEVEQASTKSSEIIQKMQAAYPNLPEGSLEMSAKVVTGEQEWD